ncbi:CrcB family protein [Rhizobium sp. NFR07]|uniref:CrcB family protein n=1 Tax=Rhizobium sp. NFR07 TaxID=1566262 RepID=UPI000B820093|nr:CrcB family protein [Rhizobium sp. NFR07]
MSGLCGGYTTFSSFSLQTLELMRGAMSSSLLNIGLPVALCVAAVAVGHLIATCLNGGTQRIAQLAIEAQDDAPKFAAHVHHRNCCRRFVTIYRHSCCRGNY